MKKLENQNTYPFNIFINGNTVDFFHEKLYPKVQHFRETVPRSLYNHAQVAWIVQWHKDDL